MSEHAIRGIDINTYLVKEPARAIQFYKETLGLNATWEAEQGAEFELPDGSYFGLWKMDDGTWHPSHGVMFSVADVPAAMEFYKAKGVSFIGSEETPVCHMAFAEDSEGNHFILHCRKDGTAGVAHVH